MAGEETVMWLLEAETPTIRYLTRRLLLGLPEGDETLQAAHREIMQGGAAAAILEKQAADGSWQGEKSFYTPKFTSSHWSMLLLAELHADAGDERVRAGAASVMERLRPELEARLESNAHSWECLWANVVRYSAHAGLYAHPQFAGMVAALVHAGLQTDWRCRWHHERPCTWGAARALWALAALPPSLRSAEVQATIESALELLLARYSLAPANYPTRLKGKNSDFWRHLNFPLFYHVDVLLVLRALAELGRLDHPGAAPALEWLAERRQPDGTWRGRNSLGARTWPGLRGPEETNRWVTLYAAWVLQSV